LQIFGMDMSAWRIKAWRWKVAVEKIERIVDELGGLAIIDAIVDELIALPGTERYRKLHEKGRLGHFIMASVRQSKILKLIPYFDNFGSKKYAVAHSEDLKDIKKDGAK